MGEKGKDRKEKKQKGGGRKEGKRRKAGSKNRQKGCQAQYRIYRQMIDRGE